MIFKDFKFERRDLLHATPFLVLTLVFQIYYHVKPASSQRDIQEAIIQQDLPVQFYFVMLLVYTHVYVYIFKAWKELAKYRLHIKEKFSEVGTINLGWLAFMLTAVGMILVMSLIFTFSPLVKPGEMDNKILIVPFLFILGFCSAIFWKALRQPTIFAGIEMQESKKYTVSAVTPEERDTLATVLKKTVAEEQLYLNPDLTIDQLSDRLKTSPRKISQVVNEVFGQNFFDFVNSYRIEKAKQTLSESVDSRLTILEVMYQSGFNSKSSFNTIFKQKTGLTPSEFRKRNRPGRP
jgi:AraC-like DNA-binding protein